MNKTDNITESKTELDYPQYTFTEFTAEEEAAFELLMDKLYKIGHENDLQTVWSVSEIEDVHKPIGIRPLWLTDGIHHDVKIELPNIRLTWLDLWKSADKLYETVSEMDNFFTSHAFIEGFELKEENGKPYLEVHFGS